MEFADALDAYVEWENGEPEPAVTSGERSLPMSKLCGLLWNCRARVPRRMVPELRALQHWTEPMFAEPPTYAVAARLLMDKVREA